MARRNKGRSGRIFLLAALLSCPFAGSATAQSATGVPLPQPRPIVASHVDAVPVADARQPSALRQAQATPPNPVSNPFAAVLGKTGNTTALDGKQRAIIAKVNTYLSNTQQLTGKFVQVGPDGSRSTGAFFISKPGRVRFEYDPPSDIAVVADGQSVVVRNTKLATQDVYPLGQTPLRFLLADKVDLLRDTNLVAVYADDVFITVVVEEKNAIVGTSRLMIMFSAADMQLKQWTVTDPQGYDTTVAVYNLDTTKRPDPSMFKIDYTNYHN